MKDAGCWAILMGGESGVQDNLNTLRKAETLGHMRAAVRAAKEVGLTVSMPFMFGLPGETYADGLKTIEFALELDPDLANFHCLTPFPGTQPLRAHAKYGTISDDLEDYTYQGAAFVPYTMTREEIHALRQLAFRRFYRGRCSCCASCCGCAISTTCAPRLAGVRSLFWLWVRRGLFRRERQPARQCRPQPQPLLASAG